MSPGMPSIRKQCQNNETYVMKIAIISVLYENSAKYMKHR